MSIYLQWYAVNQISIWARHVWSSNYLEVFDVDNSGSHHEFCVAGGFPFFLFSFSVLSPLPGCSNIIYSPAFVFEMVVLSLPDCTERTPKLEKKQRT